MAKRAAKTTTEYRTINGKVHAFQITQFTSVAAATKALGEEAILKCLNYGFMLSQLRHQREEFLK